MPIITLLTDFGLRDEYVGVLKGVIYSINPTVSIVDISHCVASQDIIQAAYILNSAFSYFPEGTIHLAVVDPGVGSNRAIIAARQAGQFVVAPDNGLGTLLWENHPPDQMVRIENPLFFRQPVSRTFHGRDIMAPVAAHLSTGLSLNQFGPNIQPEQIVRLPLNRPTRIGKNAWKGQIVYTDKFGNLVTNIDSQVLWQEAVEDAGSCIELKAGDVHVRGLVESYSQVEPGQVLLIVGSRNCLEIAVNQGNAAKLLGLGPGTICQVSRCP